MPQLTALVACPGRLPWPPGGASRRAPRRQLHTFTFLRRSSTRPTFMQLEDGHTGILIYIRKKFRRTTGEAEAQQLKAASGTDAKVSSQYSHISAQVSQAASSTNAKVPALRASSPLTCALVHTCTLAHLRTWALPCLLAHVPTPRCWLAPSRASHARGGACASPPSARVPSTRCARA